MSDEITTDDVLSAVISDETPTGCEASFTWNGTKLKVKLKRLGFVRDFDLDLIEDDCGDSDMIAALVRPHFKEAADALGNEVGQARERQLKRTPSRESIGLATTPVVRKRKPKSVHDIPCEKCGSKPEKVEFISGPDGHEHLSVTCRCGYRWSVEPRDAK